MDDGPDPAVRRYAPNVDDWGSTLLDELLRLRLETVVDNRGTPAARLLGHAAPPGTPIGLVPPTDPTDLTAEVRARISIDMPRDLAGTEVSERLAGAQALLEKVGASSNTRRILGTSRTERPAVDHDAARKLARYWELGTQPVTCRTLIKIDGDAATQFPSETDWGTDLSHESITRAHSSIALAMIALWPLLFATVGVTVITLLPGSRRLQFKRSDRRRRIRSHDPADLPPLRFGELVDVSRRFLGWGRVVFESPGPGSQALIRTMIHPSGDVETTVIQGATEQILNAHAAAIATWLTRLVTSLQRVHRILIRTPFAVSLLALGSVSISTHSLLISLVAAVVGTTVGWIAKRAAQVWLRSKLLALTPIHAERIEGAQSATGPRPTSRRPAAGTRKFSA